MHSILKPFSFLFLGAALLAGCGKTIIDPVEPEAPAKNGEMWFHFDSRYGTGDFLINKMLPTAGTDSVSVSELSYFISNIELQDINGKRYKEPNSYHLIQANNTTALEEIKVKDVPAGQYTKVFFQVGIDAARNSNPDVPVGDLGLDPGMKWQDNYIFLKSMGTFYDATAAGKRTPYYFEIGNDASLRYVSLTFPKEVTVNDAHKPQVHLHANIKALFTTPHAIDLKANPDITGDAPDNADAQKVADNYANMFRVDHIHAH